MMNAAPLRFGRRPLWALLPAVVCAVGAALVLAVTTRADTTGPIVDLGPVTVADGTASVSGEVTDQSMAANLTVNGQPVAVDASGKFSASVNLNGQSGISLSTSDPVTGRAVTTTIPLSLAGPDGVIPGTVLDQLKAAGVSVTIPPGGLTSLDGLPVMLTGGVLDPSKLQTLTINGTNVLPLLGSNGGFSQQVPGSSKEATIQSTDRQGVSQKETFGIQSASSTITTSLGTSVSAAGALGLRIAAVRYVLRGVQAKKTISMIVSVKDRRGYLVRDAIVSVRGRPAATLRSTRTVKLTNKLGRAVFILRPRADRFGKRLFLIARAKTARAQAVKATSVRLPKLHKKAVAKKGGSH